MNHFDRHQIAHTHPKIVDFSSALLGVFGAFDSLIKATYFITEGTLFHTSGDFASRPCEAGPLLGINFLRGQVSYASIGLKRVFSVETRTIQK